MCVCARVCVSVSRSFIVLGSLHFLYLPLLYSLTFSNLFIASVHLSFFLCGTTKDNDNRVREVSHRAMQSCVGKVKNSMGPLLRSILGPWLAGMCDPYGSAASAAQTAFSTAFSPEKQTNVLTFGFKVIISVSHLTPTLGCCLIMLIN